MSRHNRDQGRQWQRGGPRHQSARRMMLAGVARETLATLPRVLRDLPDIQADESTMYDFDVLSQLDAAKCPKFETQATVQVVNQDSFDAAIALMVQQQEEATTVTGRVAVLNLASHRHPGGGWLTGATAQEEALCYRSSLGLSLHPRYYPWRMKQALYTRDVVIIRSAMDEEHKLLVPDVQPADLPVLSVISVAAVCRPPLKTISLATSGGGAGAREVFSKPEDRELTKNKMRLSLRIAAVNGNTRLVLGALGCGAFRNPTEEVADCWREVLAEDEFSGGWWEYICFAVYDRRNEGNFDIFNRVLGGLKV